MSYCCSQCSFTTQFESALMMHHQLHHEASDDYPVLDSPKLQERSHTLPRMSPPTSPFFRSKNKTMSKRTSNVALPSRTSSATRLFDRLRARITKSRTLFSHPEEPGSSKNLSALPTQSTTKAPQRCSITCVEDHKETYACHLCSFDADRITVLDRHLLNDHKLGLENLLKLVMAKTKDGLYDDKTAPFGIRQPYYKAENVIIEEGEFIIETVTPQIKILKHASTNTEIVGNNNIDDNYNMITKDIENLLSGDKVDGDLMGKMKALNDYMCKFVSSSNALKKALDSKVNVKEHTAEGFHNLGLGPNTPRDWERAHSEKMERNRNKYPDSGRGEKSKSPSDSFYF